MENTCLIDKSNAMSMEKEIHTLLFPTFTFSLLTVVLNVETGKASSTVPHVHFQK